MMTSLNSKETRQKKTTIGQKIMSNILRVSYLNGINDEWLARLLGCTVRTLCSRKKDPSKMTLEELEAFCEGTHTDISEMIK